LALKNFRLSVCVFPVEPTENSTCCRGEGENGEKRVPVDTPPDGAGDDIPNVNAGGTDDIAGEKGEAEDGNDGWFELLPLPLNKLLQPLLNKLLPPPPNELLPPPNEKGDEGGRVLLSPEVVLPPEVPNANGSEVPDDVSDGLLDVPAEGDENPNGEGVLLGATNAGVVCVDEN